MRQASEGDVDPHNVTCLDANNNFAPGAGTIELLCPPRFAKWNRLLNWTIRTVNTHFATPPFVPEKTIGAKSQHANKQVRAMAAKKGAKRQASSQHHALIRMPVFQARFMGMSLQT